MHNNSLRKQLSWQSKQKNYLFKNLQKNSAFDVHIDTQCNTDILKHKKDDKLSSQYSWTQTKEKNIKSFKNNYKMTQRKQILDQSKDSRYKERQNHDKILSNKAYYQKNKQDKKPIANYKKAATIKFEVFKHQKNKQNQQEKVKYYSCNNKKNQYKNQAKNKSFTAKKCNQQSYMSTKNISKQIILNKQYKQQRQPLIYIEQQLCNTTKLFDQINQKKQLSVLNINKDNINPLNRNAGKITKNSKNQNHSVEKKKDQNLKRQKIFVKLDIEHLKQTVDINNFKNNQKYVYQLQKHIQSKQYQKYCETQRQHHLQAKPYIQLNKTQLSREKIQNQNQQKQEMYSFSTIGGKKQHQTRRFFSQKRPLQRKLNKSVQLINNRSSQLTQKQLIQNIKQKYKKIVQKNINNTSHPLNSQLKLKRQYKYQKQDLKLQNIKQQFSYVKNQKINENKQNKVQQAQLNKQKCLFKYHQTQNNVFENVSEFSKNIFSNYQNCHEYLRLLFDYLDISNKGFLTDTNCRIDSLTPQLKNLFSVILHQIKTKKKFYNLQKFVSESIQLLKVKSQIYEKKLNGSQDKIIGNLIRQHIQILKKKNPLHFIKHTHTESYHQTNLSSKRPSMTSKQSFVFQKLIQKPQTKNYEQHIKMLKNKKYSYQTSYDRNNMLVDDDQPQKYLQIKYGIQITNNKYNNEKELMSQKIQKYMNKM